MKNYLYPIYRNKKLLPWIKWWILKGNKIAPKHLSEWINSASAITLTGVYKGSPLLNLNLNGNTSQTGTPTPEAPVPVNVVKEINYININDDTFKVDLGGKNIFNLLATVRTNWRTTIVEQSQDSITIKPTQNNAGYLEWQIENIKPNATYTIYTEMSVTGSSNTYNGRCLYRTYDSNGTQLTTNGFYGNNTSSTITTPANASFMRFLLYSSNGTDDNWENLRSTYTNVMICEGTDTTYSPYVANPIELCKIGTYQDVIYKLNNKWYVAKYTRHTSLKISDMNNSDNYPGWKDVPYLHNDYPTQNAVFTTLTSIMNNTSSEGAGIAINTMGSGATLFLQRASFSNLTQTQWIANYPNLIFELYYGIQTSETTEITETNLINQLEAIYNAKLQSGTNTITQTNADLPFYLNFQYYEKG